MTVTKTNALRELVRTQLLTVLDNVFYEEADENAMYPHCVFSFNTVDLGDFARDDIILDIDLYTKGSSVVALEEMADQVEALFNNANLPQSTILPTFFRMNRHPVPDTDKSIRRRNIKFQIQNYESEE